MDAGRRNVHASLQVPIKETNAAGELAITGYREVTPLWVAVSPLSSREQESARQAGALTSHRVSCVYWPGVTTEMRLVLEDGQVLQIAGVLDVDYRHVELELACVEAL